MSLVSNELSYKKDVLSHPIYDLTKTPPIEGSAVFTVGAAGGDIRTFEIPNSPFNLAKSYLSFTVTPVAAGAGRFNWIPVDTISMIRELQLQTKGGLVLSYIPNFDLALKAMLKPFTQFQDFITLDEVQDGSGGLNGLSRSDALVSAVEAVRYNGTQPSVNYTEPKYMLLGGSNTATPVIYVRLPFSLLFGSIFSLDKDLFVGEVLQLRVTYNSANRMGWSGTSATDPTVGAAVITSASISSPFLYTAMEKNPEVISSLQAKANSAEGLSTLIDYIYINRQSFSASTLQSMTLRFNRNNGLRLKKIIYCLTPAAETAASTYDIGNTNGVKVPSYYDQLNNQRLVNYNISCLTADGEDFMYHRALLKGSVLQSQLVYQYNWVHIRSFDEIVSSIDTDTLPGIGQNLIQGLPLDQEQKYDWIGNTANLGFNHYAISICSKVLVVNSSGIQLM